MKRIRVTREETEQLGETNYTMCLFVATIIKSEKSNENFDRLNTLAGLMKVSFFFQLLLMKPLNQEHFCTSLCTGESEWPKPVFRGQARPGLEKDIILIKSLPVGIYSLLGIFQTQ